MSKYTLKVFMICLTLLLVAASQPALGSDWAKFQKDVYNTGVTADRAPITNPTLCPLSWNYTLAANVNTAPIVFGDMMYIVGGGTVYAFNKTAGRLVWSQSTSGGVLGTVAIGNGTIFVPTSNGKIFAFDINTGSSKWSKTVGSGKQLDTPITYSEGKIYFGEAMGGHKYYCYDENGTEIWNRTATTTVGGQGSYYWAGAAVIGNSLIYGDDDGHLVSVNKDTGTTITEINVSKVFGVTCKEIRSSVLYVEELKRIYFTSKGNYCYALGFNSSDGTFNTSNKYIANIGYSTSTPSYYKGRIYVGAGGMYGGGSGVSCLDADLQNEIWHYAGGTVQSSPAISTYYDNGDGTVYIYFTVNGNPGGIFCLKDFTGCTSPILAWSYANASQTQYSLGGAVISDGWVYFGTNNKYTFGFTTEKPPVAPVANFTAAPTSGNVPLTVQFTDASSGSISSYSWDFNNDGVVDSTEKSPLYTYSKAGTYSVNLTVANAGGSDSEIKTDYIVVSNQEIPDTTNPVIDSTVLFPANTTAGSTINISVNAKDNVEVTEVTAGDVQLTKTDGVWQGSITAPSAVGSYSLLIKTKDAAGNTAETSVLYRVLQRAGGANIAVSPRSSSVAAGSNISLAIKVKNTQNIDDTFKVLISVSELPDAYQANLFWFDWTEKVLTLTAGQEVLIPIKFNVPEETEAGRKLFRVNVNSETSTLTGYDTGYLVIS